MSTKNSNKQQKKKSKYTLLLTQDELTELKSKCDQNTLSAYIRNELLNKNSASKKKAVSPKLINAIGRIGSNLNQLTRLANTNKQLDQQVLNEITAIRKVMQQLIENEMNKSE